MDVVTQAKQKMDDWHRGATSAHYETGGRGPGHVSTGKGDHGGVSYGSYQYATNVGGAAEYVAASRYKNEFTGLNPGTPEFTARWKEVAAAHPKEFAQDQHDFIQTKYYDVQMGRLKDIGIDLSDRGPAVQDALWSTSVQYRGITRSVFEKGLETAYGKDYKLSDLSDEQIVRAVQDYKHDNVKTHFSKSPDLWDSLASRALNEKTSLVGLARYDEVNKHPEQYQGKDYQQAFGEPEPQQSRGRTRAAPMADGMLTPGERGDEVGALQVKLIQAGYTGKDGQPLTADKHYGPNTEHAVREFQRDHGLSVDGKAGKDTLDAINGPAPQQAPAQPAAPSAPTPAAPARDQAAPAQEQAPAGPAPAAAPGGERIRLVEPMGSADGKANRTIPHGTSGEDAFREMHIHHPNANREAVRTGDASKADRPSQMVEGELETVRTREDKNGIPLVHKDLIMTNQAGGRGVMVPNPVEGYVQVNQDKWNSISIYSHPAGHPDRELVGQVLHGERGTTPYKTGDFVEYGAPLIKQSDAGTPGAVHAHIELEPDQFRKYMGDILNDRITLGGDVHKQGPQHKDAPSHGAMADGMLTKTERGDDVKAMQEKLASLGYQGKDGKPLSTTGYFGDDTLAAVQKFQRDHGLKDDGKAGDKTLTALDAATAEKKQAPKEPSMRDASHADNGRYNQAVDKLQNLEQQRAQGGLKPLYADKEQLERVAGQMVVSSKAAGLQQIDSVVARPDGTGVIAVQGTLGDPASRRALVEHNQAAQQTVEASTRQADTQSQSQQQEQNQNQQQEQNRSRGM